MKRGDALLHAARIHALIDEKGLAAGVRELFEIRENKLGDALAVCAAVGVLLPQPNGCAEWFDAVHARALRSEITNAGSLAGACPAGPALADLTAEHALDLLRGCASVLLKVPIERVRVSMARDVERVPGSGPWLEYIPAKGSETITCDVSTVPLDPEPERRCGSSFHHGDHAGRCGFCNGFASSPGKVRP